MPRSRCRAETGIFRLMNASQFSVAQVQGVPSTGTPGQGGVVGTERGASTMLVPRSRLVGWTAATVVPLLAFGGSGAAGAPVAVGLAVLALVLVAMDALRAWPLLDGVVVELPAVVRLVKHRPGELPLHLRTGSAGGRRLRLGLALPSALTTPESERQLVLPEDPEVSLQWTLIPMRRGSFSLHRVSVETPSSWGLWDLRRSLPVACELRVHPDLAAGLRANAQFLAQGPAGRSMQRQVGKGRDFEKLRDYLPGDASDEIHWKATAKRLQPVTKVYQLERTQEVYVVVDASRLSVRPVESNGPVRRVEPLLEYSLSAALVLGAIAERQGDLFGLVTFSDTVHGFVRARNGAAHYNACRETIVNLEPRLVSPDFEELGTFLRLRLRRRALLLLLTSLEDPVVAEGFLHGVDLLRQQHLCVVVQPQPLGVEPAYARGQAGRVRDGDALHGVLSGHLQWQTARELEIKLRRRGVSTVLAPPSELASALVSRYLHVKQRQLL